MGIFNALAATYIFHNVISPHFLLFYFKERFDFWQFFEWKIKRINDADLFLTANFDHIYQVCH